ncbi:MAG: hypothetical protein DRJ13_12430, partial [Bacteroidetes bacterium]
SYDSSNEWVNGHNMKVNNKRTDITYGDIMTVGKKFNIKKRKEIFKKMKFIVDNFQKYATRNHVIKDLIVEVEKNRPKIDGN